MRNLVLVSGGFDPLHVGHLDLIRIGREIADGIDKGQLVVAVNGDEYVSKKHSVFMPENERHEILSAIQGVDFAAICKDPSGDVSEIIRKLDIAAFVVGPDHADILDLPEAKACLECGVKIVVAKECQKTRGSSEILQASQGGLWKNPPVTCSAILRQQNGSILVVQNAQSGKFGLPGGFMNPGEIPESCLIRELREEIGLQNLELSNELTNLNHTYFGSLLSDYPDGRTGIASLVFLIDIDEEQLNEIHYTGPEICWGKWINPNLALDCNWLAKCNAKAMFVSSSDREAINNYFRENGWTSGDDAEEFIG